MEGGFWHNAPQVANRTKEMTRIVAVRFTTAPPAKPAGDLRLITIRLEAHFEASTPQGVRLSKSAHPRDTRS